MSLTNPPRTALVLCVPDDCRMHSEFEAGDCDLPDIKIALGSYRDNTELVFERKALERFVALAQRTLAVPVTPDHPTPLTLLVSTYGHDILEESRVPIS